MKKWSNSSIINGMAIQRDQKMTLRLSAEEKHVMDEIGRRTGSAASTVMRQALLEKAERMGVHLQDFEAKKPLKKK